MFGFNYVAKCMSASEPEDPSQRPPFHLEILSAPLEKSRVQVAVTDAVEALRQTLCPTKARQAAYTFSLKFSTNEEVQALNHTYRGQNKPTNVLSFEDDEPHHNTPPYMGDIIIADEVTRIEAAENNIPVEHHISHLVVHGILHLFGFDHMEEDEACQMEDLEGRILNQLGIANPYKLTGVQ